MAAGAAVLGLLGSNGCRGVLDVDGYGLTEPGPFEGACSSISYASESCRDCIDTKCCSEAEECGGDAGCVALSRCLAACDVGSVECRATCNLSVRRTSAASRVVACVAEKCDSCAMARPTFGGTECSGCLERYQGGALMSRFARSVSALEYDACRVECPFPYEDRCTCDAYAGENDEGSSLVGELSAVGACDEQCRQPDWSCVGDVYWPPSGSASPLELHLRVDRVPDEARILDVDFASCRVLDEVCDPEPTPSDATGLTVLNVSAQRNTPYFSHLRVTWPEPDATRNAALLYFYPPLQRSPAWTFRRVVPRAVGEVAALSLSERGIEGVYPLAWSENGGVIWSAVACNGRPSAGLTVSLQPHSRVFYIAADFTIDPAQTETSEKALGAMFNVAPGPKTLELKRGAAVIGRYAFTVEKGAITTLALSPTPDG